MTKRIIGLAVALATTMALFGAAPAQARVTAQKFTLNVVHGIPGLTVDVCVNGAKAITDFEPGDVVTGGRLPEGRVPPEGDSLPETRAVTPCSPPWPISPAGTTETTPSSRTSTTTARRTWRCSGTAPERRRLVWARVVVRHTADAPAANVWADGSPLNAAGSSCGARSDASTSPRATTKCSCRLPARASR